MSYPSIAFNPLARMLSVWSLNGSLNRQDFFKKLGKHGNSVTGLCAKKKPQPLGDYGFNE